MHLHPSRSHGHTAVTNDSNQTDGDFLFSGRLVPLGRKGNIVYARSLRRGEEDTGEGVHVKAGEQLVIPAGELIINSREVDAYYNPAGTGGYAPVANTVWTWYQMAPEKLGFFLYFLPSPEEPMPLMHYGHRPSKHEMTHARPRAFHSDKDLSTRSQ